jgi:hypothetical protein
MAVAVVKMMMVMTTFHLTFSKQGTEPRKRQEETGGMNQIHLLVNFIVFFHTSNSLPSAWQVLIF